MTARDQSVNKLVSYGWWANRTNFVPQQQQHRLFIAPPSGVAPDAEASPMMPVHTLNSVTQGGCLGRPRWHLVQRLWRLDARCPQRSQRLHHPEAGCTGLVDLGKADLGWIWGGSRVGAHWSELVSTVNHPRVRVKIIDCMVFYSRGASWAFERVTPGLP